MKLSKMKKSDLELYSYIDLTKKILEESKKPLNTPKIFKKICDLLEMTDEEYAEKIGDFYTSLTTDKSFILLEDGNWDLRDHHSVDLILDDDTEDEESFEEESEEDMEPIEDDLSDGDEEDSMNDIDGEDEEDGDDLTIISEDELEEE